MPKELWCTLAKHTHYLNQHYYTCTRNALMDTHPTSWCWSSRCFCFRWGYVWCLISWRMPAPGRQGCVPRGRLVDGSFVRCSSCPAVVPAALLLLAGGWILTLFENWNYGWSGPVLLLLGANTLGSGKGNTKWQVLMSFELHYENTKRKLIN